MISLYKLLQEIIWHSESKIPYFNTTSWFIFGTSYYFIMSSSPLLCSFYIQVSLHFLCFRYVSVRIIPNWIHSSTYPPIYPSICPSILTTVIPTIVRSPLLASPEQCHRIPERAFWSLIYLTWVTSSQTWDTIY